ncbi:MAG: hypothetical protein DMD25_02175 [Gemmatimonadetes bacterium]|nr:MAG: hypothetical protein DMD27_02725 [Gemmatimonadota bacterium]PYP81199.1 MAG: hypothetical protein DMD25_02175 [Gemmatimonadota bacterium]
MPAAVACLLVLVVALQGGERLRKTDLVRLLSSVTLAPDELAALIRRNCLSFTPSGRDRADFVALGAGPVVLREIDACVRRGGAPRPAPTPARPTPVATPAPLPVPRSPVSGVRTGFVLGVGQHAAVGMRPTHALLFEVRDTVGAAVGGQEVRLGATNGHLTATRLVTDTNGHVEVDLTLGPRVGPVQVSATVGAIERQATLYAEPGPAVQLAVRCGDAMLGARVAFAPRGVVVLRVSAQDGFANAAPVTGLQAAPGDRGVLRIAFVGTDASGTLVRVEPRDEGSTSLVIVASGQRRDLSVTVAKQPPPGIALCP